MRLAAAAAVLVSTALAVGAAQSDPQIGRERAVPHHLQDGDELKLSPSELVTFGRSLFEANWTAQDGAGRPRSKGDGKALSDPAQSLVGARGFNRISGPDANSCQGCHSMPYGISGGSGDVVTNAFEQAERFDFVTFDRADAKPLRGTVGESDAASLQTVGNSRTTRGLFGAGYLEMLARQITADLQRTRDGIQPGQSAPLSSKGLSFGTLARRRDGSWDVAQVEGVPAASVAAKAGAKPSLVIRPWLQSSDAVSLREVTNDSLNRHHGIQTTERFGVGTDPDGDGVVNEMTRADVTAMVMFEASLAVPGRVIPNDADVEAAVLKGEHLFDELHCTRCHVPALSLDRKGWIYAEPNPYNPSGNLRPPTARTLTLDLARADLPLPRLAPAADESMLAVPAYTDFKLHDIGQLAGAGEALGSGKFLTRRLWGVGNQPPYFHHGLFTTMRQAVLAHGGEALNERVAFEQLVPADRDAVIEFLKSLQVLPPGTRDLIVDEHNQKRSWPPHAAGTR